MCDDRWTDHVTFEYDPKEREIRVDLSKTEIMFVFSVITGKLKYICNFKQ
jgi:hypothetical protein